MTNCIVNVGCKLGNVNSYHVITPRSIARKKLLKICRGKNLMITCKVSAFYVMVGLSIESQGHIHIYNAAGREFTLRLMISLMPAETNNT